MNSSRILRICLLFLALTVGRRVATGEEAARPTNFVIIVADDLGYGDLSCYGGDVPTPHLDRLAAEGLKFTDFHSNGAVCSPTRASLVTGRYQQRSGVDVVLSVANHRDVGLGSEEVSFAEPLREAGYRTAVFGKWHLGYKPQFNPVHQGFERFRGFLSGNVDYHSHVDQGGVADWWHGDQPVRETGYTTDLITDNAVAFISEHAGEPFCLYLAHEAVHYPYQTREDVGERVPGQRPKQVQGSRQDKRVAYAGMLEALDDSVGSVVDTLRKHDIAENTLVFFTSDNGPAGPGSAGNLRGRKGTLFEGGHRVPAIAWWPGRIQHGVTDQLAITMDLMPTMLSLADIEVSSLRLDGVNLAPLLQSGAPLASRDIFWEFKDQQAVRSGVWKLVRSRRGVSSLFHMEEDPSEKNNLASLHPAKVAELEAAILAWKSDVKPEN